MTLFKKTRPSSLLGLSLDGSHLEGVWLRRRNGSLAAEKAFSAILSLNPLSNDPELVGREIRNHLEKAGIRERQCAVSVPLNWALTLHTKLPDLPEADIASFLEIEAERGFAYGLDALLLSVSRFRSPSGESWATQVAIPKDHITRLETALKAAKLKPLAFSLGITALQSPDLPGSDGVLALAVAENSVGLQATLGGGVAALRALEGTLETEARQERIYADVIARESRITLGQLPEDVRGGVRRFRVFSQGNLGFQLAEEIRPRIEAMGMKLEVVRGYMAEDFGVQLPPNATVSPAFSIAARYLTGKNPVFDFLPPRVNSWQQLTARYSSGKLVWAGGAAGVAALFIALLFFIQQYQLSNLRAKEASLRPRAQKLDEFQQQIRKYRPWFDESMRTLTILRRLTEAFPEDGVVTAKTVEIREQGVISCAGTAKNRETLHKTIAALRATKGISDVTLGQTQGTAPVQFTFDFRWIE